MSLLRLKRWFREHLLSPVHGSTDENLKWNRHNWNGDHRWRETHAYGYRWGRGHQQINSVATHISEKYLLPHLDERRDLVVLELAPGAGRFTTELIRLSSEIHLMDLNPSCIKICKERFKYFPNVHYHVNDGKSCNSLPDKHFDLIASYDSMVHMAPEIVESYVKDFAMKIKPGGLVWLDHSGKGARKEGDRTAMTAEKMAHLAERYGLKLMNQYWRNDWDCISVMRPGH